ncbi:ABC transporter permease [Kineothrix sedimenti]|uniref:ABC transporter permease n=1 Tax=Kineothrix sedimenti TaxID=3123317 RepID=A0ABZ3F1J9_9FIRM
MSYFAALNPMNLVNALPGCIAQGVIWGIMALGVYVTFRLLDFADLTVDGSFATGGAVTVMLTLAGVPIPAALLVAIFAGLLAGLVTGLLHTALGIPPILSGILTQIALYSVNLHIMGMAANMALSSQKYNLLVSLMNIPKSILVGGFFAAALIALLYWYFGTEQGCSIRATGCNQSMSKANGININFTKVLALALSNGLVGLAGGLMAQYQGFSDINMGRGAIVIGLAAVIIGEVLGESILRKRLNFALRLVFVVMGGIIYYVVVGIVLWLKLNSNDLKLFTAIIVAVFLAVPYLQGRSKNSFARTAKASLAALQARKDKED